jgi:hypothetical protein
MKVRVGYDLDGMEIRRAIIRSAIARGIQEIQDNPQRGARKLVDLGSHFSRGRFQKRVFREMQDELVNPESAYFALVTNLVQRVDAPYIERLGINIGFNSWTHGAAMIRENERKKGYNIPWCLVLNQTQEIRYDLDDLMRQGEALGIFCYCVFAGDLEQTEALCAAFHKHRDSAVLLLLPDAQLPRVNIESLDNVMLFLPQSDARTQESAQALAQHRCLYGLWTRYGSAKPIVDGGLERAAVDLGAPIAVAVPEREADPETREAVRRYACCAREKKTIPALLVDLYPTIEEVDRIISVEPCMLGVEPDGTVFTAKGRNEKIDVCRISLDDVLLCTMPRVTYTAEDEDHEEKSI